MVQNRDDPAEQPGRDRGHRPSALPVGSLSERPASPHEAGAARSAIRGRAGRLRRSRGHAAARCHPADHLPLPAIRRAAIVPPGLASARLSRGAWRSSSAPASRPRPADRPRPPNMLVHGPYRSVGRWPHPVPVVALKHRRRGVAEHVGDQLERYPVVVEQGRAGVSEFVRSDARHPGGGADARQLAANVARLEHGATSRREHEPPHELRCRHLLLSVVRCSCSRSSLIAAAGSPIVRCEADVFNTST